MEQNKDGPIIEKIFKIYLLSIFILYLFLFLLRFIDYIIIQTLSIPANANVYTEKMAN